MHHLLALQTRTLSPELSSLPASSILTPGGTALGFSETPGHRVEKGDHEEARRLLNWQIKLVIPHSGYQKLLVHAVPVPVEMRQNRSSLLDHATIIKIAGKLNSWKFTSERVREFWQAFPALLYSKWKGVLPTDLRQLTSYWQHGGNKYKPTSRLHTAGQILFLHTYW